MWQSLDATEMWEDAPTFPVSRFDGTAAELTTACGSTLIKTRAKSNFVVGLHIDFGPAVAFGSAAEYNEIVALTQYKISLVRQSVVNARDQGRISSANGQAMLSQLDAAAAALTANNPVGARKKIQDFLKKVNIVDVLDEPDESIQLQRRSPGARREHPVYAEPQGHSVQAGPLT